MFRTAKFLVEKDPEYIRWYPPNLETITNKPFIGDQPGNKQPREIAYYIHVPFCSTVCKYCPFTKYQWKKELVDLYFHALKQEISRTLSQPYFQGRQLAAGYFGGGTPTTLTVTQLKELVQHCSRYLEMIPGIEMTIEANPDTVDRGKSNALLELGFNRISFGVQSFHDSFLQTIGRVHTAGQAEKAIESAHTAGFENIAIDLLYRLPGQTIADWRADVQQAIDLGVHHISTYCFFIPRGTQLYREASNGHVQAQPGEDEEYSMYQAAIELLTSAGYQQHTVYDFALPGKQCLHHAVNWQAPQGEYCGFGPGAFSFNRGYIYCNVADVPSCAAMIETGGLPAVIGKRVSAKEQMSRFMVLGLKYLGVQKKDFEELFGTRLDDVFADQLADLEELGFIIDNGDEVRVTDEGKFYIANVCKAFYSEESRMQPQPRAPFGVAGQKEERRER